MFRSVVYTRLPGVCRNVNWIEDLIRDTQFAFRALWKERGFRTIAILSLALAIGINTELEREWPSAVVQRLLRFWTRTTAYLEAVAAGEMRRDLAGHPTEPPTQEQCTAARLGLERRASARRGVGTEGDGQEEVS